MKLQVFSLRYDPLLGRFDDQVMQDFFLEHTAISVSDHMVTVDRLPVLVLLVSYREKPDFPRVIPTPVREEVVVSDADRPLFLALRKWRNDRAKREGRPSYVIFTNAQLAAVALARPQSNAALGALPGIGEARVRDYGAEVLALVGTHPVGVVEGPANG